MGTPNKEEKRKNKLGFTFSRIEKLYQDPPAVLYKMIIHLNIDFAH
jgi:hypothetical protein